ncbi:hypothetical protein MHO82_21190 [Vibrio sp. Of7-15]|uniref:hypothetical protein n=1 Tax=Vibrio sp. Of7-15 TaxID=2724879 RepID=UPI001EF21E00|nr:hypothetical protein [Vibrio sp. Of7-15]MCG7499385.1 hypothetical protein [Vibrio sp. Of7-15]
MKLDKRLYIDGQLRVLAEEQLILELSAGGRATFVVQGEAKENQLVELHMGYQGELKRYFDGFITKAQSAQNGYTRFVARERAGLLAARWPISIQHPTVGEVIEQLSFDTGLAFVLPNDADYVFERIPNFTSQGTGYQLLNNLGRAFNIPDFCWYQQTDGTIYVGSFAHSRWVSRPIELDNQFSSTQRGGNSMTLSVMPSVRPGVVVNGQRITQVQCEKDQMTLYWQQGETAEKRKMHYLFPELAAGHHLPRFGRVEAVTDGSDAGHEHNPFRPRYAVDVQLLDEHGQVDALVPIYKAVPLPVAMAGAEQGQFATPKEGSIVEIAFAYGRSDKPFIRTVLGEGWSLPGVEPDEQLIQQRAEVFTKTDAAGNHIQATDQHRHIQAFEELHDVDRYLAEFGCHDINVSQHSKEHIAGQKLIETLGHFEVMAGDDLALGSLGNMHQVTAGDYVQVIGQLRDMVIGLNDQVTVLKDRIHTIEQNDTLTVGGQQQISIAKDRIIKAQNITEDADTIKLNGGTGVITCESICPFTGKPHVDGSTTVFAGK